MRWIGVDLHKHYAHVVELSDDGQTKCYRFTLSGDLAAFCQGLRADDQVVVEASTNSFAFADIVSKHVGRMVVVDAAQTRGVVTGAAMNDQKAAEALAKLLRSDFIRPVWVPPIELRAMKAQVSYFRFLDRLRTKTINRIRALFQQELTEYQPGPKIGRKAHPDLDQQFRDLPGYRLCLCSLLRQLNHLEAELTQLERVFGAWCRNSKEAGLLLTIPGVGVVVAITLMAHIGSIERFPSANKLCAYAGIVPKIHQSGKVRRSGHITRMGPGDVRWALRMAILHLGRFPSSVTDFLQSVGARRPKKVARVAAARKLLTVIWSMLKHGKPFRDEDRGLTARKGLYLSKWAEPSPEAYEVPVLKFRRPSRGGMHRDRTPSLEPAQERL